jgi:hypothetical protein
VLEPVQWKTDNPEDFLLKSHKVLRSHVENRQVEISEIRRSGTR